MGGSREGGVTWARHDSMAMRSVTVAVPGVCGGGRWVSRLLRYGSGSGSGTGWPEDCGVLAARGGSGGGYGAAGRCGLRGLASFRTVRSDPCGSGVFSLASRLRTPKMGKNRRKGVAGNPRSGFHWANTDHGTLCDPVVYRRRADGRNGWRGCRLGVFHVVCVCLGG